MILGSYGALRCAPYLPKKKKKKFKEKKILRERGRE